MKRSSLTTRIERRMLAIVTVVAFLVATSCLVVLYQHAIQLREERLLELIDSQARLIESVAKFDAYFQSSGSPGSARSATLSQIKEAHRQERNLNSTGEIVLGERIGDQIVFILPSRKLDFRVPPPVDWATDWAKPMRLALSGQSGIIEAKDYTGDVVIGAYRYLPFIDLGLVVKVDKSDVQEGFFFAAGITLLVAILAIVVASALHRQIVFPLVQRIYATTQRLRKASSAAKIASRAKSEFLARMSHEIRTPMNAVIGTNHLLEQTNLDSTQANYIAKNQTAAKSLLGLINDILDFSKLESRRIHLESIEFSLDHILQELTQLYTSQIKSKGLQFNLSITPNVPRHLIGDPVRLRQILSNLLSNAVKFADSGTIRLEVSCALRSRSTSKLIFYVVDEGIGMSEKHCRQLFRPFSQGDGGITRKYGGTGLGLSICKNLVDLMQGSISVESTQGKGSRFCVKLEFEIAKTISESPRQERQTASAASELRQDSMNLNGLHLLVIEDNEINQEIITGLLEGAGARVSIAGNGKAALERLTDPSISLALVDIELPDIDGFSLARQMKKQLKEADRTMPMAAVTAHAFEEHRSKAYEAGMHAFVSKPIEPVLLFQTINRLAGRTPSPHDGLPPTSAEEMEKSHDLSPSGSPSTFIMEEGMNRVGPSPDSYLRIANKFRHNFKHVVSQTSRHLDTGESKEARRLVHTLKGTSGNLGMRQVSQIAAQLEHQIRAENQSPDSPPIAELLPQLDKALRDVFQQIPDPAKNTQPSTDEQATELGSISEKAAELDRQLKLRRPIPSKKILAELMSSATSQPYRGTLKQIEEHLGAYRFDLAHNALEPLLKPKD